MYQSVEGGAWCRISMKVASRRNEPFFCPSIAHIFSVGLNFLAYYNNFNLPTENRNINKVSHEMLINNFKKKVSHEFRVCNNFKNNYTLQSSIIYSKLLRSVSKIFFSLYKVNIPCSLPPSCW